MKKLLFLLLAGFLLSCSQDSEKFCIDGTCYNELSRGNSYRPAAVDILFVIDNSGSMVGEQHQLADSFQKFASVLDQRFQDYHIAITTTGMLSGSCPACEGAITQSCINASGENGRFQDTRGINLGTIDKPEFEFDPADQSCRVVSADNKECFYDQATGKGTVFVGVNGCGYERGLASAKSALSEDLLSDWNQGFLRDDALLAVVVISDEGDCGEVGDVSEGAPLAGGNICYYASAGVGPEGETVHPSDPNQKPYQLTPVAEYRDFLMALKDNRPGMVKFTTITGLSDPADLSSTTIEYEFDSVRDRWNVISACTTPDCEGNHCAANPAPRYIEMAQLFGIGINGYVDTICQSDFSFSMECLANFMACQQRFELGTPVLNTQTAELSFNNELIPRYSCSAASQLTSCQGLQDSSCSDGPCVATWTYDDSAGSPTVTFADHFKPCELIQEGDIEIVVVEK